MSRKSGHRAQECEEPPNLDNVECRKCNKSTLIFSNDEQQLTAFLAGHFAKDCPDGGSRACRNCGQEGHISKDCDQPKNMDNVTCRNCEETGHFSRDCPKPTDCKFLTNRIAVLDGTQLIVALQGPRSNAPTARSLDTPRSVARSLPRNRTPMKARHTAAAAATTNSHSSPTPAMAAAP